MRVLYSTPSLTPQEVSVLERIEEAKRSIGHVLREPRRWTGHLRRTTMARAVRGSNTIEGYNITVEDAMALAVDEKPLDADRETWLAVRGYQRAMTYVLQTVRDADFKYSTEVLQSLHFMMVEHDLSKNPGRWRPGWVAVRDGKTGDIVHEGADSELVQPLMAELVDRLNSDASAAAPVVSAAMAHLNLALIHPFSDGNGRMARCVQTLVLSRGGTLDPAFSSIEEHLGKNTPEYYAVLAEIGGGRWDPMRDARPWIRFCLTAHYRQALTLLRRQRELQRLWEELEGAVTRHALPARAILAAVDAASGFKVRNATYRATAEITRDTASRDLKALVDAGMLIARGEKRGRYYVASPGLLSIAEKTMEPRRVADPFESQPQEPPVS